MPIEEMADDQIQALITDIDRLLLDDVGDPRRMWSLAVQREALVKESERRRWWPSRKLGEWWYSDAFDTVAIVVLVIVCAAVAGWLTWVW